jgi:ribosomal protein S18 acetylase RimI-like enzyme
MSALAWTIRPVGAGDVPAVARLHVAVWQVAYRGLLPDAYLDAQSVDRREIMWRGAVGKDDPPVLVADVAGDIAGFVWCGPARDEDARPGATGEVYAIYVAPDWWGSGVSGALMAQGLAGLAALGYAEATLWVMRANTRAIHFYTRQGWAADGAAKIDRHGDVLFDEVRYRRALAAPP